MKNMDDDVESLQFLSQISTDVAEECENRYKKGGIDGCLKYLQEKQASWKSIPLNVAIIGNSGVGKSSFINAMRGLGGDDDGAAETGNDECTLEPTPYGHPNNGNLQFWDLPGVGTLNFPKSQYLEKIGFERYDFFIVISAERFTENDAWLAANIKERGKQLYFVRTQIGVAIDNDRKGRPNTHNPESVISFIRQNIEENLKSLQIQSRFFLIDSYERDQFDFVSLESYLIEDFPEVKRQALILSLGVFSESVVRNKVQVLRQEVWLTACASAAVAVIPVPGLNIAVDFMIVAEECIRYFNQLGFNPKTLQKTARLMSVDANDVENLIREEIPYAAAFNDGSKKVVSEVIKSLIIPMITQSAKLLMAITTEQISNFVPVIGSFIAGPISFAMTYKILTHFLNKYEAVALKVVNFYTEKTILQD